MNLQQADFFRHAVTAYHHLEQKQQSKEQLHKHISVLKQKYAKKQPSQRKLESDFKVLEKHVNKVIQLDHALHHHNKHQENDARQRVDQLQKTFSGYVKTVHERNQKIRRLEQKVKRPSKTSSESKRSSKSGKPESFNLQIHSDPHEIILLRNRLYNLQDRYFGLRYQGYSDEQLAPIKEAIDRIKEQI